MWNASVRDEEAASTEESQDTKTESSSVSTDDSNSTEIERLRRQETAFEYWEARETLRDGDTENRLIAEELNLCDETKRLTVGIRWLE